MNANSDLKSKVNLRLRGFSLVEVLAAIAIIGIITFIAIPNLVRIKQDGERSLAISRAETLNMAMASYLQANGQANSSTAWSSASTDAARYTLVAPYVSFAASSSTNFMPAGYSVQFPTSLVPLNKVTLKEGTTSITY